MDNEKKKVNTGIGYKNGKYRPSVFFDKSMQIEIEKHFREKGYRTFNEYVNALVLDDMKSYGGSSENMADGEQLLT